MYDECILAVPKKDRQSASEKKKKRSNSLNYFPQFLVWIRLSKFQSTFQSFIREIPLRVPFHRNVTSAATEFTFAEVSIVPLVKVGASCRIVQRRISVFIFHFRRWRGAPSLLNYILDAEITRCYARRIFLVFLIVPCHSRQFVYIPLPRSFCFLRSQRDDNYLSRLHYPSLVSFHLRLTWFSPQFDCHDNTWLCKTWVASETCVISRYACIMDRVASASCRLICTRWRMYILIWASLSLL